MRSIRIKVNAKINLSLYVYPKKENEFHSLDSVLSSVDLCDTLTLTKRHDRTIYLSGKGLPTLKNTAYKAAQAFMNLYNVNGVDIHINKGIPFSAGMGGSSADAAAVLYGMKRLYEINDTDKILAAAKGLGCDVPYMMSGGYCHAVGYGETFTKIADFFEMHLVVAKSNRGVSTAKCYAAFDALDVPAVPKNPNDDLIAAIKDRDLTGVGANMHNMLFDAACSLVPEVRHTALLLSSFDPLAVTMTGSGSAVVALCKDRQHAQQILHKIADTVPYAAVCKTCPCGIVEC